jgi:hypothetical protein
LINSHEQVAKRCQNKRRRRFSLIPLVAKLNVAETTSMITVYVPDLDVLAFPLWMKIGSKYLYLSPF